MKMNENTAGKCNKIAETLLRAGESVTVRCAGFSCLAYRDRHGIWRSLLGNRPLPEILEICK